VNKRTRPTYPKWVLLLSKALSSAAAILYVGLILAGIGLHFWTVSLAYHVEGIGPAIVALLFPVGAEPIILFGLVSALPALADWPCHCRGIPVAGPYFGGTLVLLLPGWNPKEKYG
jgi:hypothetical protein